MNHVCILTLLVCATDPPGDIQRPAPTTAFPLYTGPQSCLPCHAEAEHACTVETVPAHATSYKALLQPEAEHIASLLGISNAPTESQTCLGCHATGADDGPRWHAPTFDITTAGVSCEACHGPGSVHIAFHTQEGDRPVSAKQAMRRADDVGPCTNCHINRDSHRLVLEEGFRLSAADKSYKTPGNLTVTRDGSKVLVVCEGSDSLIVLDAHTRRELADVPVGHRPHGLALNPTTNTAYVTNRGDDTLTVVDLHSCTPRDTVPVGNDPHGLAVSPDGTRLYVLNTGEDTVLVLDTATMQPIRKLPAGDGPWAAACSTDGTGLHVTNVRPQRTDFRMPHESEITVIDTKRGMVTARHRALGADALMGIASAGQPGVLLFVMKRTKSLVPMTRLAQGWTITNGLGVIREDGQIDQVLLDRPGDHLPDPTDIAVSPNGQLALVTSGGANCVAAIDIPALLSTIDSASVEARREILPNHLGTSDRFVRKRIKVGTNPRGVAFTPDGRYAYVTNALDDTVSVIDVTTLAEDEIIHLNGPTEITQVRQGQRLFYSASNARGHQFSCASCHPDGHINGLPFDIEADGLGLSPVDNRSLRGVLDTPPFKWEGTNPSIFRQCGARLAVFFTRLEPFTQDELRALVMYQCTIEQPRNRHRDPDGLTIPQRRGKAVFQRTHTNLGKPIPKQLRCTTCHVAPYGTNRSKARVGTTLFFDAPTSGPEVRDIYDIDSYGEIGIFYFEDTGAADLAFDTPHLTHIDSSAPYLHNGAAPTLESIWTRFNMLDRHGYTADLTRQQFNDMIAYLKAL